MTKREVVRCVKITTIKKQQQQPTSFDLSRDFVRAAETLHTHTHSHEQFVLISARESVMQCPFETLSCVCGGYIVYGTQSARPTRASEMKTSFLSLSLAAAAAADAHSHHTTSPRAQFLFTKGTHTDTPLTFVCDK